MRTLIAAVAVAGVMVALFETDVLPCGMLKSEAGSDEFVAATLMELLTLCSIPVALRLFKFGCVQRRLVSAGALLRFGLLRLVTLCALMVANTLLYYMYMNVAFGYMAIILLLCLMFVLPTMARCEAELNEQ